MSLRADEALTPAAKPRGLTAPLADSPIFRALWLGQAGVQTGIWVQTVVAQWILVDAGASTAVVTWVQAALSLPVLVFGIPAGVLADIRSRRGIAIIVNAGAAVATAVMVMLDVTHELDMAGLLGLTAVLGAAQALNYPAWSASVPDLVDRTDVPSASMLASININLARVVGPAIGGFLIAWTGPSIALAASGVGYAIFAITALVVGPYSTAGRPQPMRTALVAGWLHVANTPGMLPVTALAGSWFLSAGGFWALLPVVGLRTLHLSASGYGIVLALVGGGAVIGTPIIAPLRRRAPQKPLLLCLVATFAAASVVIGTSHDVVVAAVALPIAGLSWTTTGAILMAQAQLLLPTWVRARGLAFYIVAMQGGLALGALLWGAVGELFGAGNALVVAAASLVVFVGILLASRLGTADDAVNGRPWADLPEPAVRALAPGRVLVVNDYLVAAGCAAAFEAAMDEVRRSRLRTGASRWMLTQDADRVGIYVEIYEAPSWDDHAQQHRGRQTVADQRAQDAIGALCTRLGKPRHLLER